MLNQKHLLSSDHKKLLWLVELQYSLNSGLFAWSDEELKDMIDEGLIKNTIMGYKPVKSVFENNPPISSKKKKTVDCSEWINEYREIFTAAPNGSKGSKSASLNKMNKFCANHLEYDKELIISATEAYIEDCLINQRYARLPQYFISKTESGVTFSELEDWCEIVAKGEHNETTYDYLL